MKLFIVGNINVGKHILLINVLKFIHAIIEKPNVIIGFISE